MMIHKHFMLFVVSVALSSCAMHDQVDLKNSGKITALSYQSNVPTNMTMFDEQMDMTATSAVFFNIAGPLVVAAHDQGVDATKAKELQAALPGFSIKPVMDASVGTVLAQNQVSVSPAADTKLQVDVATWGLRRMTYESKELVPFVALDIKMTNAKGDVIWQKRDVSIGNYRATFDQYKNSPPTLQRELEKTAEQAAQSVAYQIIYH